MSQLSRLPGSVLSDGTFAGPPRPPLAVPTAVFAVALLLAILCFGYTSHRFFSGAHRVDAGDQRPWLPPAIACTLGVLTLLMGVRWLLLFGLAFSAARRPGQPQLRLAHWPPVSILVPAYNEAQTIEAALKSLLEIDYPTIEIIVVDDGSKDDTLTRAHRFEGEYGGRIIRVFTKPNGGKWSALNHAYQRASHELILCVDADSRLDPQGLRSLVARMADPAVGGVAGQVRVRNRINILTRLQGLEYVIANGLVRMAQSVTGTVLVIPGPIGLFRRSALEEVYIRNGRAPTAGAGVVDGPFEGDTFAEDFDLSVAILALGFKTVYEPAAISLTKAPDRAFVLLNQRYRWCRGTLQVLRKFGRRAASQPDIRRPGLLGWLAATYLAEFTLLPLVYGLPLTLMVVFLTSGGSIVPLLGWVAAFWLLNLNAAALFVAMHGDSVRLLAVVPFFDFYQTLLLNAGWIIAVVDEIRGRGMRW